MAEPNKKKGAPPSTPKGVRLLRPYLLSLGLQPHNARRRCVACRVIVDNSNLGAHHRSGAFAGPVWCLSCSD